MQTVQRRVERSSLEFEQHQHKLKVPHRLTAVDRVEAVTEPGKQPELVDRGLANVVERHGTMVQSGLFCLSPGVKLQPIGVVQPVHCHKYVGHGFPLIF
jgi:hypothetical protein